MFLIISTSFCSKWLKPGTVVCLISSKVVIQTWKVWAVSFKVVLVVVKACCCLLVCFLWYLTYLSKAGYGSQTYRSNDNIFHVFFWLSFSNSFCFYSALFCFLVRYFYFLSYKFHARCKEVVLKIKYLIMFYALWGTNYNVFSVNKPVFSFFCI